MVERRFCHVKQWRGVAARYVSDSLSYRAGVLIHAVIAWVKRLGDAPALIMRVGLL